MRLLYAYSYIFSEVQVTERPRKGYSWSLCLRYVLFVSVTNCRFVVVVVVFTWDFSCGGGGGTLLLNAPVPDHCMIIPLLLGGKCI